MNPSRIVSGVGILQSMPFALTQILNCNTFADPYSIKKTAISRGRRLRQSLCAWNESLMIRTFVLLHTLILHLLELLLLFGREHSIDLVVCCLVNCFFLGRLLLWSKR